MALDPFSPIEHMPSATSPMALDPLSPVLPARESATVPGDNPSRRDNALTGGKVTS